MTDIARQVDRLLEEVRSCSASGAPDATTADHVRRSAAEVAEGCAAMVARRDGADLAAATARRLASIAMMGVLAMEAGVEVLALADPATDIILVLSDAVGERFRSFVQVMGEHSQSWSPPVSSLPVELFLHQLADQEPAAGIWQLATLWLAISLKIAEVAMVWQAAPRPGGPPLSAQEPG